MTEQKDELLKMEGRELAVHTMERVCHGVGDIFCEEVFAKVKNVFFTKKIPVFNGPNKVG